MDTDRYLWPCDCESTGQTDNDGNTLYYDTKPMPEGRIGLGLYIDSRCKYDYTGDKDIADLLGGDIAELEKSLTTFNDAFDVYKVCQPCKAYALGYNKDLKDGSRQGGDPNDENGGYTFDCYDDAGYTNVNQCMKFKTKTEMLAADFRDLMLAHQQGNIVEVEIMGYTYGYGGFRNAFGVLSTEFNMAGRVGPSPTNIALFVLSLLFVGLCGYVLYKVTKRDDSSSMKTSLLGFDSKKGAIV
jgi:hypothetical protein